MDRKEEIFNRVAREYRSTIYTVCFMYATDQDEAADLMQEVLIELWQSIDSFAEVRNPRSWIYRLALNVCISQDRRRRRHHTVPLTMDIDPYDEPDPNSQQMELLRRRISRLPMFDRAIVLLWLENMSYDEIATIVGISVKNVSVRLVRIREQLKQMSDN